MLITEIIIIGMCLAFFGLIGYVFYTLPDFSKTETHHDNRKGSHYNISHQVRRDEKKERGY